MEANLSMNNVLTDSEKKIRNKKSWIPDPYVIIFSLMVIAAIATWIIPAGEFDRVVDEATQRNIVQAGTYHHVEQNPVNPIDFFVYIQKGMMDAADISIFLLIIGGTFGIFKATGAIDALIARIMVIFGGKTYEKWIFVVLFAFFYTCSAIFGMSEEGMVFVPFIVSMSVALGYDAVLGLSVMILSSALGYTASLTNPFNIGIAQAIAGLPVYSGMWYRMIVFVVILVVTCTYMLKYAEKVKADPQKSLVADIDYSHIEIKDDPSKIKMTKIQKRVIVAFAGSFACMIFSIIKWHFWLDQLTCVFLAIGILVGIVARMSANEIAENFVEGAKTLVFASMLVGLARGIQTVMENGLILDSIINGVIQPLSYLPKTLIAPFMLFVQSIINLIIPSSSAMAVVTMPIMTPIADVLGVQRQTACLAYQFGDGITNLILPFWPTLVIGLSMSEVPYQKWVKFAIPLVLILLVIAATFLAVAELIQVGPF